MGPRIAIVLEDDPHVRGALEFLLADLGWRPVSSDTPDGALARLDGQAAQVGAIITDFNLGPGPNGVEAIGLLAQAGIAAPALVMSSSMRGRAEMSARAAGHEYLPKPVSVGRVEAWLAALA